MTTRTRADKLLVERGLAPSREKAQAMIMAGLVSSEGAVILKPGALVGDEAGLVLRSPLPFVGRGGLKLAEALDRFGLNVEGAAAVDIGASTGGFTDCLLQRGARRVYAVDVDTKQLDWGLRRDPRVVLIEKNARYLADGDIPETPDFVTMDVSFISVLKVLPALHRVRGNWILLTLIKPQFEAGRREVGKSGVVRDPAVHTAVLERVADEGQMLGFMIQGIIRCSTTGQKGNVEFFARWIKDGMDGSRPLVVNWIKEAVRHENH